MASTLDGTGQIKMEVLDGAQVHLQRVHGIVEHLAIAARNLQDTSSFRMQLQRAATPLAKLLKPHFAMIADQVTGMIQISSRAGAEQPRVRALREAVAHVRMQMEIAATKTKERHAAGPATEGGAGR
jgi:hypothetical protein